MKNLSVAIALLGLLSSCSPSTPPETVSDPVRQVETGLVGSVYMIGDSTWTIESRMAHYGVPGVSVAVIKDHRIEWAKSYGVMNIVTKEPVTNKTLFQAGSISKPVAAYGALHFVDKGIINVDENVNTYLKSWKLPDNEFTKNKKVALKHLLSHTGGLTVHGFLGYSSDLAVPTLLQVLDGTPPANSAPIRVDKIPEESFRYSGGGYCIVQQMLIDIEEKPFPQIMKETVLSPLGMDNSTYEQPLTGTPLTLAASGYLPDNSMTKGKYHTYPEMAAAGLWTTAEDLARFAIDVQNTVEGKSSIVLTKATADKMLTPFVASYEGLGLFLDKRGGDIYFGHGGWDEGFSSEMKAHKEKGYGVVILTNSNHPAFIAELMNSVAHVYQWSNYIRSYKKLPMDSSEFAAIRGRYHNGTDGSIRVFNKGDRLYMKYLRSPEPSELFKISDTTYVSPDDNHGSLPIQFINNPEDETLHLVFINDDKPREFIHARESADIMVPYEYLLAGNYKSALKGYLELMKSDPNDKAVNEENLNHQGYALMNVGKIRQAKDVFKINLTLYPKSSNAYDSYAEACMQNGDNDEAIENYEKSLKLDPNNKNAKEQLEKLKVDR